MKHARVALPLCAVLLACATASAQDPPPQQEPQTQDAGGGRGGRAADPVIRPYERVITKDATSKTGVFGVHRIKDRLYYEIPKAAATDFLADVRKGVWSEVYGDGAVTVDAYRRNLQRAYVETLGDRVNGRAATADDARAFFRGELKTLDADLKAAASKTGNRATKLHLEDIQTQIAHALDPAIQNTAGAAAAARPGTSIDEFDVTVAPDACWLDYTIRPRNRGGRK